MIIILFTVQGSLYVKMIKTALFNSRDKLLERVLKTIENNSSFHPHRVIYTISTQKWIWLLDIWHAPIPEKLEPRWVTPIWSNSWKGFLSFQLKKLTSENLLVLRWGEKKWIAVIYINSYWVLWFVRRLIL